MTAPREGAMHDDVVVITGAGSGIGRAAALLMAAEGASVVIGDVDMAGAEQTAAAIQGAGGSAVAVRMDVSDENAVRRVMGTAAEAMGRITVVVNNAGVQRSGAIEDLPTEHWDLLMSVNPRSCFLAAKHSVPYLKAAGGGVIVNTASLAGLKGGPGQTAYSASKGAIIAFSKALAAELAGDGIRVNCLCPGWIATPFNDPAVAFVGGPEQHAARVACTVPLGREGTVDEAAAALLFLCSSASSYMTGQVLVVDGGVF